MKFIHARADLTLGIDSQRNDQLCHSVNFIDIVTY